MINPQHQRNLPRVLTFHHYRHRQHEYSPPQTFSNFTHKNGTVVVVIGISLTIRDFEPSFLGLLALHFCGFAVSVLHPFLPGGFPGTFDWPPECPSLSLGGVWSQSVQASWVLSHYECAGCIFVGGGSTWHFCLQVLSREAVSAPQLAPSIRKAAHREIRHISVADCREFGRKLAGDNLPLSLFLCVFFPFSILNNCLIVKRDDSLLEISSVT